MKSINNDGSNNNNGWLGFSLSPHINMEVSSSSSENSHHHHHHQSQVSAAPNFFHSVTPPHLNYGIYYGADHGETAALYSPLSVMPLKSDGSLCIMEALNRSQPQGNFFSLELCIFLFGSQENLIFYNHCGLLFNAKQL